jgi:hypothetical protein
MSTLILKIESVEMRLLKSNPPQLQVIAHGQVSTTGWENPELLRPKMDPVEGIYQLDFFAEPPEGNVPQIIMSISASYLFTEIPKDLKGIKVVSSTNSIEQTTVHNNLLQFETNDYQPQLETLMGVEIIEDKLKIRVSSGGCTDKDSFRINVIKGFTGIPPYIVEIYRIIPDYCKRYMPEGVVLEYKLSDIGIEPFATFRLENKIGKTVR